MQQPCPEPQTFAPGRAYCSVFNVHSLLKSYHCPHIQPFALSPSPGYSQTPFLPRAVFPSHELQQLNGDIRRKAEEPEPSGLLPCGGWILPLGHNCPPPPPPTIFPSRHPSQSILSTVFLPTVRSFCQNNIFLRVNITFGGAGKGYSSGL